jgi:excisionase family DNA binding protein
MTERSTERSSQRRDARRVSVGEAAALLGVSKDAVRMRIRRGTLRAEKAEGRVYVWLTEDLNADLNADHNSVQLQAEVEALLREKDARLQEFQEQVYHFRQVLAEERDARRRADTIIAQLTQANAALAARLPELPPSSSQEPSQLPVTDAEEPERAEPHPSPEGAPKAAQEERRSSWWSRLFGG